MNKIRLQREYCFKNVLQYRQKVLLLCRVSPTRPAPFELPQGLIAARAKGCSGAMQGAYPLASLAQLARARDL
ncbi:MAG: hypothetical protein H6Q18_960 [Bacteroidetes bacterium]|nr:hypothetical protein [Bacteroidota bacterium]